MTREELRDYVDEQRSLNNIPYHVYSALIDGIDTLEQEPVIDKIRAEIEQLPTNTRINWDGCCPDIDYPEIEYVDVTKAELLEILDKYKAEKE